jgi:putative aldouronate transport system substrate-binding protein
MAETDQGRHGLTRRAFVTGAVGAGLSATALTPLLAACSGQGSDAGGEPVADAAAVKGGPKTTPDKSVSYPDGYVGPIASDKGRIVVKDRSVTLRVVVPQDPSVGDWNRNAVSTWYEQRTGVKVRYQVVAGGDDTMTKVNAMIASGDLPDVFLSVGFTNAQLQLYGSQGVFLPMNKLIDDYGVEIKRIFKDYPDTKHLISATDGNIYTLPYFNDCFHCNAGNRMWIYQPWLDKLGLDMPQSLDEFEEVLKAFKTGDPNGNGKSDEIPLTTDKDTSYDSFFMGSFLYNPGTPWLVLDGGGKVGVTFNQPGWREGLRYLNKLYAQGLIAKESFTQTPEQLQRQGNKKGDVVLGAVRAFYWGAFLTVNDDNPNDRFRDYVAVPTLEGPDGTRTAPWNHYGSVTTGQFVITRTCKNPAVALLWGDGQYEMQAHMRNVYGRPEKSWRWAKRGEVGINGKQAVWSTVGTWPPPNGEWWAQHGLTYAANDFRLGEAVDPKLPTFEKLLYENTKNAYYPYRQEKKFQLPPLYPNEEQAAQTGELSTTINNYVTQSLAKFTIGQLDVNDDQAWKTYTETLDQMGLADYVRVNQEAYEAKYK